MNSFYAHSLDGKHDSSISEKDWEILFSTFQPTNQNHCRLDGCPECEKMAQSHGHLNKVAWWAACFLLTFHSGISFLPRG